MVILPGITWTRNSPEECFFAGNEQLISEESTRIIFIPPGITSSGTRNLLEEWDSAGNYQLIDEESN
jgi:hypothetical protein